MKKQICLLLMLFMSNCSGFKEVRPITSFDAAVKLFHNTPQEMTSWVDDCIAHYAQVIETVLAIPDEDRTFENTVRPIRKMLSYTGDVQIIKLINTTLELLLKDIHERKAAQAEGIRLKNWYFDAKAHEQLYAVLKQYQSALEQKEDTTEKQKKSLAKLLKEFSCSNNEVDPEIQELNKELNRLERLFAASITEAAPPITLTAQEMQGVPKEYRSHCKQDEQGNYQVTGNWVLFFATDAATREKVYRSRNEYSYSKNYDLITEIYKTKAALAKKYGLKDPATYQFKYAGLPVIEVVDTFLNQATQRLIEHVAPSIDCAVQCKDTSISYHDGKVAPWDLNHFLYLMNTALSAKIEQITSSEGKSLTDHFSFKETIDGICSVMGAMLSCKMRVMPHHKDLWHDDVFVIEVSKHNAVVGYVFFDLFSRDGKPQGASYTVRIVDTHKDGAGIYFAVDNHGKRSACWDIGCLSSMIGKLASIMGQMLIDGKAVQVDGFGYGMLAQLFRILIHDETFLREITKDNPFKVPDYVYKRLGVRPIFQEMDALYRILMHAHLSEALLRGQELESAWKELHEKQFAGLLYVPKACPLMNSLHLAQFGFTSAVRHAYESFCIGSLYTHWKEKGMLKEAGYIGSFCDTVLKKCDSFDEFFKRLTQFLGREPSMNDFFDNLKVPSEESLQSPHDDA